MENLLTLNKMFHSSSTEDKKNILFVATKSYITKNYQKYCKEILFYSDKEFRLILDSGRVITLGFSFNLDDSFVNYDVYYGGFKIDHSKLLEVLKSEKVDQAIVQ